MKERVLKALRRANAAKTKYQIASLVEASHSAVSAAVNELVRDGSLKITGEVKLSRGRPAPKYKIAR